MIKLLEKSNTNYEAIKEMNVEELSEFLADFYIKSILQEYENSKKFYSYIFKNWLKEREGKQ